VAKAYDPFGFAQNDPFRCYGSGWTIHKYNPLEHE
jgi:hypothetical protein